MKRSTKKKQIRFNPRKHWYVFVVAGAIVALAVVASFTLLQNPAPAASGNIYATLPDKQVKKGEKVAVTVRITPGAHVDTVTATVSYDKSALSYDKAVYTDSPFSSQIPPTVKDNTVTIQSAKLGGSTVEADALIGILNFTAVKDNPAAPTVIYGNAARAGAATNPAVAGRAADETKNPFAAPAAKDSSDSTTTPGGELPALLQPAAQALQSLGLSAGASRQISLWGAVASVVTLLGLAGAAGIIYWRKRQKRLQPIKGETHEYNHLQK